MSWLPAQFWQTGAPWGLVGLFVLLIAWGRLIPAQSASARERDWLSRLAEANARTESATLHGEQWREQAQGLAALSARRSDETEKLLEIAKVSEGLLRAVNEQLQARKAIS